MARRVPKMVVNPEFLADPEVRDAVEETILAQHMGLAQIAPERGRNPFACVDGMYADLWSALPERGCCEIPEEGTWIIVKSPPHTALEWDVPQYSIWRAKPFYRRRELILKVPRKTRISWPFLRAVIQTPGGELHLLPGEFVTTEIERWLDLIGEGVNVNFMGLGEPEELGDQLFYFMAHGIPRKEALLLLLPGLASDNFVYLTLDL